MFHTVIITLYECYAFFMKNSAQLIIQKIVMVDESIPLYSTKMLIVLHYF